MKINRIISFLGLGIVLGLGIAFLSLAGCNEKPVFSANTRFLYSVNAGASWSETIQEIEVGNNYYLAIEMEVVQSVATKEENTVVAKITIPNTNILECHLDDHPGVSITGDYDPVTKSTTYPFNLAAGTNPTKFRAVFDCVPLSVGKATIFVEYDDNVSPNWDCTGTIKYVEPISE